jgi:hypothetical protein
MLDKGCSDVSHDIDDAIHMMCRIKGLKDFCDLLFPEVRPYDPMNAFISKDGKLMIFHGHIKQHTVSVFGPLHLEAQKHFSGTIDGVNKATTAFNEHPYFSAGAALCLANGFNDAEFIRCREKTFGIPPIEK